MGTVHRNSELRDEDGKGKYEARLWSLILGYEEPSITMAKGRDS